MVNSYFLDVMRFDLMFTKDVWNGVALTFGIIVFFVLLILTGNAKDNYKQNALKSDGTPKTSLKTLRTMIIIDFIYLVTLIAFFIIVI